MPLIALVATCVQISTSPHDSLPLLMHFQVYAAFCEYETGEHVALKLQADTFEDKYRNHIRDLEDLKADQPRRYHRVTADLFSTVYGCPFRS
jgi:hypothetical protein